MRGQRMTVTLFIPCFVDALYPRAGMSVVQILERLGHKVVCPAEIACCGQPAFNSGYWAESRAVAVKVLEHLKNAETVVIVSGSCGAMVKIFIRNCLPTRRRLDWQNKFRSASGSFPISWSPSSV